jgi:cysteine desulfurase family protein
MKDFMDLVGANPGRSGHRLSIEAGRVVYDAREKVSRLLGLKDPMRVVFGANATDALNLAMRGILRKGDHVVTTSMEHNSVMRPLNDLKAAGVETTVVGCDSRGFLDIFAVEKAIRKATKMIVVNHASNVVGSIAPIRGVGKVARERDITFLVDAAQTAGAFPINMRTDNVDLLAFTGHKALLGPQGTGGLAIHEDFNVAGLRRLTSGGTGSRSESEVHPDFLPDRYESGTLNAVGLAGLAAAVGYILDRTVGSVREKEMSLVRRLLDGLEGMEGVRLYGGREPQKQTATISINLEGQVPSDVGLMLDERYDILCRVGLHCAPQAHKTIGTFPNGSVRFGMGWFNTTDEVDRACEALGEVVSKDG